MLKEESGKNALSKLDMGPRSVDLRASPISIGRKIRSLRLKRELTLSQVSRETNVSASLLSQIENEKTLPTLSTLSRLSDIYGVNISDIVSVYDKNKAIFRKGRRGGEVERIALEPGRILLGKHVDGRFLTESYMINHIFKEKIVSDKYRNVIKLLHIIDGSITYKHNNIDFSMSSGDSMLVHLEYGQEVYTVDKVPARFIKIISACR